MRETIKANFGVSYIEKEGSGGSINVKISGKSYAEQPGLNMKKE